MEEYKKVTLLDSIELKLLKLNCPLSYISYASDWLAVKKEIDGIIFDQVIESTAKINKTIDISQENLYFIDNLIFKVRISNEPDLLCGIKFQTPVKNLTVKYGLVDISYPPERKFTNVTFDPPLKLYWPKPSAIKCTYTFDLDAFGGKNPFCPNDAKFAPVVCTFGILNPQVLEDLWES